MTFENVKALIYVLVIAMPALYVGGRIAKPIFTPREFAFLRNAWIVTTIAAFLFDNFFYFAAVVTLLCLFARASRIATLELFIVLVFAVPAVNVEIGGFGVINTFLDINNERVLAVVLLLPILFSPGRFSRREIGNFSMPDRLVVGYVLLMVALESRLGSATNVMRAATLYTLDILIPYFVISRKVTSIADFRKLCLAFVIIALPLSLIAAVELVKKWHLYSGVISSWGKLVFFGQEDFRGSASAIGPIIFGFVIMAAIGCLLAVQQAIAPRNIRMLAWAILLGGLAVSLSRGPWAGTVILMIAYVSTGSGNFASLAKLSLVGIVALLLAVTAMPDSIRLSQILPFASIRADTIDYRQRLLEQAMIVIARNPWLGSVDYRETPELQEMMQGQKIIDIVNHYVKVALDSGLIGLGLFFGFFATILVGLRRVLKSGAIRDGDINSCARAARATLIAILVTIATVSSIDFIPYVYWSFAGLCVALVRIAHRERAMAAHAALTSRVAAE